MRNERIEAGGPQMRNERTEAGGPQMRNEHMGKNEPEIWDARGGMGRPAMREDHMGTGQPAIWDNHMDGQGPVMPDCMEQRNPAMQNPYMGKCTYGNTQPPSDSYFRQHTVPVQDSDVQRYMTPAREKSHADPAPAAESAYHSMGGMSYEGGMGFSCEPAKEGQDNSTPQSEGTAYMGNFGADIQQPERNGMENPAETTEEPDSNNRQEASDEPAAEAKNKMEVSGCSFCY